MRRYVPVTLDTSTHVNIMCKYLPSKKIKYIQPAIPDQVSFPSLSSTTSSLITPKKREYRAHLGTRNPIMALVFSMQLRSTNRSLILQALRWRMPWSVSATLILLKTLHCFSHILMISNTDIFTYICTHIQKLNLLERLNKSSSSNLSCSSDLE